MRPCCWSYSRTRNRNRILFLALLKAHTWAKTRRGTTSSSTRALGDIMVVRRDVYVIGSPSEPAMIAIACPISPSTVHRILAHISPLEDPLPKSLISEPLLQRHHFLGLTPDDAAEYLAWPSSSDPSRLLQLLEGPLQDLGDHLNVKYTADCEEFLAHVCISSDLRLVFLWEIESGWQYHNLATMPFPLDSVGDLNDAYSRYSKTDFLSEPEYEVRTSGGDDDDSYWNSYGQQDDSAPHFPASKAPEDTNSEDAYWARYSNIQGKELNLCNNLLANWPSRICRFYHSITAPTCKKYQVRSQ